MIWLDWFCILTAPILALSAISDYRRGNLPGVWCSILMFLLSAAAVEPASRLITTYGV